MLLTQSSTLAESKKKQTAASKTDKKPANDPLRTSQSTHIPTRTTRSQATQSTEFYRTEAFGNLPKNLPSSKGATFEKPTPVKPEKPSSSEDSDKDSHRSYHSASSEKESDEEIEIMDAAAIRDAIRNATDAAVNDAATAAANAAIANLGPSGGDSALSPSNFYGEPKEDAITWLQQVEAWRAYKNFNNDRLTGLFPLLLKGQAYLWYQSLANGVKTDATQLVNSFKQRYEPTPLTKIQLVSEAWSRKQKHDESVDTYVAVLRKLQATIDVTKAVFTDNNMRDAIKTGLKPSIRQYVLQQAPATLDATIEAARKAEQAAMPMPGEEVTLSASLERIESKINRLSLRDIDHSDSRHRSPSTTSRSQSHHQEENGTSNMHSRCASLSPSRTSSNRNFSSNRSESPYRRDLSTSQRPNSPFAYDRRKTSSASNQQRYQRNFSPYRRNNDSRPQRLNRNEPQQTTFYNRGQRKQVRFANNWNSDQAFNGLKNRSTRYGESYSNRNHWAQNKTCFQCGKHGHIARYCRSVHVQNPNA